ncbi:MAG TPA: translocation/assembly module TamB domain-containing protein [Polyangiaceae bacterium]|nr:translocation/assembly module TamB domain-containing protein [Polyangiaceae bacterium]
MSGPRGRAAPARRTALALSALGAALLASPCRAPPAGEPAETLALSAAAAAPSPSAAAPSPSAAAPGPPAAVAPLAPPRVSFRARVVSVAGRPPEPGQAFVFDWQSAGAPTVTAPGAGFSPWAEMGPREAQRFEESNRGRAERGTPLRLMLGLRKVVEPTRVALEVRLEGSPAVFPIEVELFGPKFLVLVLYEGGRWRATTTAAYNRRYWPDFAAAALAEADRPKRFPVADRLTEPGDELASYREGIAALRSIGVNTFLVPPAAPLREALAAGDARLALSVHAPPGYAFDYKGRASPPELDAWAEGLFRPYREAGFRPDDVALFGLADEPGWYFPAAIDDLAASPEGLERFRGYLRARGLTPAELGAARWADVAPLGRSGARDLPTKKRHYWTTRFLSADSSRHYAAATRSVERAIRPNLPVFTNWNTYGGRLFVAGDVGKNPGAKHPDAAMAGHDWFDFARERGGTMLWTEGWFGDDYAYFWPYYLGKLGSAAARAGLATGGYLVPRAVGQRAAEGFEQQTLALVGSGAKAISLFTFGPEYQFPGNCYSERPGRVAHVASALRLVAAAEDVLWPGRRPPAEAAIVVPRSAFVWDGVGVRDATNPHPNAYHPDYAGEVADIFFAFAHANVPVDFLGEDDVSAQGLARYKAVYLTAPELPDESLKALAAWLRGGGTLVTVLGAGTADAYGRPSALLSSATGVEQGPAPGRFIVGREGPPAAGLVRAAGPQGPVWGPRGRMRRHAGEALAWFESGAPAIVRRGVGRGRHLHFDFFPGVSYFYSSRAKNDHLPVAFSEALRRWLVEPALAAGVKPPVRANVELVETPLLLSPEGAALTLLNWTGGPIDDYDLTVSLPFAPRSVRSARRGPLPFEAVPGGARVRLPLGGSDVLAIKPLPGRARPPPSELGGSKRPCVPCGIEPIRPSKPAPSPGAGLPRAPGLRASERSGERRGSPASGRALRAVPAGVRCPRVHSGAAAPRRFLLPSEVTGIAPSRLRRGRGTVRMSPRSICMTQPPSRPSQPGARPSQPGARPSHPGARPSQPGPRRSSTSSRPPPSSRAWQRRNLLARLLCALLAVVGALPLLLDGVVRLPWVRRTIAERTSALLESALGLDATFRAELYALPLELVLYDLRLASTDGPEPAVYVPRVRVAPSFVSLLAGSLDVGDVELERPRARLVLGDEGVKNLRLRAPKSDDASPKKPPPKRLPFRSLALRGADIDLRVEGASLDVALRSLDVDLDAGEGPLLDLSVRLAGGELHRRRPGPDGAEWADDDALCRLRLRAHGDLRGGFRGALVHRLEFDARLDGDPAAGAAPSCEGPVAPENRLALSLERLRVEPGPEALPRLAGRLALEAPARLAARVAPAAPPLEGWVALAADADYDGRLALPSLKGTLKAAGLKLAGFALANKLDARLETTPDEARLVRADVEWADGHVALHDARVFPFRPGVEIDVARADVEGIRFEGLMRDLDVTKHTHIRWDVDTARLERFRGRAVDPERGGPVLSGDLVGQTTNFEIYDAAYDDPAKKRVFGVRRAEVRCEFGFSPRGVLFEHATADLGRSKLWADHVMVGFHGELEVDVRPGSYVDLEEISPLASIGLKGKATLGARVRGPQNDPHIEGTIAATEFWLGDTPLADELKAKVKFQPFLLEFFEVQARKRETPFVTPRLRLDFDRPGVGVETHVSSPKARVRDLLAVLSLERDPRFADLEGEGEIELGVRYDLRGPEDACADGILSLEASARLASFAFLGEHFGAGHAEVAFAWYDRGASTRGIEVDVRSFALSKGAGSVTGSAAVLPGGRLRGQVFAHHLPLSSLEAMQPWGRALRGDVGLQGELGGTLEALTFQGVASVSPLRIGQGELPASSIAVRVEPPGGPPRADDSPPERRCGGKPPPPSDLSVYESDESQGLTHLDGALFGGQVLLRDVRVTRQKNKRAAGEVSLRDLDLGAVGQLSPSLALSATPVTGKVSAELRLDRFELARPERTEARLDLLGFELEREGQRLTLRRAPGAQPPRFELAEDRLAISPLGVSAALGQGVVAALELAGEVRRLTGSRDLALSARLEPLELRALAPLLPRVESVRGKVSAAFAVTGRAAAPLVRGDLLLEHGALKVEGFPLALEDVELVARVDEREVRVERAEARVGTGSVRAAGRAPLRGFELGEASLRVVASDLRLPFADGIDAAADADLVVAWRPPTGDDEPKSRAAVTGDVTIGNFVYTRPVNISSVGIDNLGKSGKRTQVEAYDPERDFVDLFVAVRASRPLRFRNNLFEGEVAIDSDALYLTGTNQRYGLQGRLRTVKGGRLHLRASEFEVRQGVIRFENASRVEPYLDVTATTDYRRYARTGAAAGSGAAPAAGAAGGVGGANAGGLWRITMRLYGRADELKVDLSSEPSLAQEDITLLLAIGMTRAELQQLQAANVGGAAALEALSAISGANAAVKTVLPIIDDFRVGSAYSTRSGRTEPTVTVGKRVSDRVRANVTTGLTENRDVRSNLEWSITPETSLIGNYDNQNDISSQGLGNLGADVRIRLEF